MAKQNGVPVRIDEELNKVLRDMARKNRISVRQASRQLAKISKSKANGKRIIITDEIQF